jgi:hypothetical protein
MTKQSWKLDLPKFGMVVVKISYDVVFEVVDMR